MSELVGYKYTDEQILFLHTLREAGLTWNEIAVGFNEEYPSNKPRSRQTLRLMYEKHSSGDEIRYEKLGPKVLVLDIETSPILAHVWDLWDQNVNLEQIETDWSILSFSAKWFGSPENEVFYYDTSKEKDPRDDSKLLKVIHSLLDEADITLSQNGDRFDIPKLNARFIQHKMKPPSSYRSLDTLKIAKRIFKFTSNKLAHLTDILCEKYKKQDHSDFAGFKLWRECLKGNPKAWSSMKSYNIYDILSLEELYTKMAPWDKTINFSVYTDSLEHRCTCGSTEIVEKGYHYTNAGKYQKSVCKNCGKEFRGKENLLSKEKRKAILK